MKRTPLRPGQKGLKRATPMKCGGRIKARRARPRRIQGVRNPGLLAWIRTQPCFRCEVRRQRQTSKTEAAHIPHSRRYGDENNVWPLCANCHRHASDSFHAGARTFLSSLGYTERVPLDELIVYSRWFTRRYLADTGRTA
jgi:hypothetical protein